MSFEPRDFLRHILAETVFLLERSEGLTQARFLEDPTLQRAFVRSLEIVGEATKKLPRAYRDAHPGVDWRGMAGMRDRLVHDYFGVDLDIVWDSLGRRTQPTAGTPSAGRAVAQRMTSKSALRQRHPRR